MADHKPLYRWSLQDAIAHNEVQDWRDSYKENCDCARAIERAIADHYHDNVLEDGTKDVLDRYGFDRVNWVLANTLQEKAHDGRFSQENKKWAKGFFIPSDDVRWHFCVESHPGLTDLFIDQAREAWQKLFFKWGIEFDKDHGQAGRHENRTRPILQQIRTNRASDLRRMRNAISQMHLGSQRQEKGCMALHQPT